MQQQSEILKKLLAEYLVEGGDANDLEAATAFINLHKPPGVGEAKPVITQAILRLMGHRSTPPNPMLTELPPAIACPAPQPSVIAAKTVTFPKIMRDRPEALYYETPPSPTPPVTPSDAAGVPPADIYTPPAQPEAAKPRGFERLKFWKRQPTA